MKRDYYSAPILLKIAQKEYDIENDRSKKLDSRCGIFISLSSALILFMANGILNSYAVFKHSMHVLILKGILFEFYNILNIISFVLLGISIIFFIKAINVTAYKRFNISYYSTITRYSETIFSQVMLKYYGEAITANRQSNDTKVKSLKLGLYLLVGGIIIILFAQLYLFAIK
ncbi:hypothetical protein [Pectinatus frisingensis]|uniref:hypothetical protein n=1 Tax=Pectinatus frisingensis TaxID=865 RepID=UPI003D805A1C